MGKSSKLTAHGIAQATRGAFLLVAASCAQPAVTPANAPPVPAGQARIWFYRGWLPSESLNLANIDMNGVYVGSIENGGAFYRDVPPGTYHVAPQSWARDVNQDTNVTLVPGQQAYVKVLDLTSWASAVSVSKNFQRDAFYTWLIPPEIAQAEIARGRSGI